MQACSCVASRSFRRRFRRAHFFVDLIFERALLARDGLPVAFRIDPSIHAFGCGPLPLAFEVVLFVVLRQPNVRLQHFENMVRPTIVVGYI